MNYHFSEREGDGVMKKWIVAAIILSLFLFFFAYGATAEPKMTVFSQSIFPYNEQTYIGFSFIIEDNKFNELQLEQLDINTLSEFSYYVFPYEVVDYTEVETSGASPLSNKIVEEKVHTVIIGPVTEDVFTPESKVSLNFDHFDYEFDWEL